MAKPTKKPRPTKVHYLPTEYDGRCQGKEDIDYTSSYVTFGQIAKLPEGETLHRFEMRLPKPLVADCAEFNAACKDLFNLSGQEVVDKGLAKLHTDVDEMFKSWMFGDVVQGPTDPGPFVSNIEWRPEKGFELLFSKIDHPSDSGGAYDEERHLLAQQQVDDWRYTPRKAGKSMTVTAAIQDILKSPKIQAEIAAGRLDAGVFDDVETQPELFAKLGELGIL